ncbi:MAG: quinol:electron acceptor oxidoreductase subunit ActD [Bryobacterales bacterium]
MLLSAEFREPHAVASAIEALSNEGFDKGAMDVFSAKPVEFHPGVLDRRSFMSPLAVAGAIFNTLLATVFMFWTQRDYPLITGGMPVTSYWAVGVIIFEMAMAGAIAGTMAAFLWESGLFSGARKQPAPTPQDEVVYLRLQCNEPQASRASETMIQAGAIAVKPLEARA